MDVFKSERQAQRLVVESQDVGATVKVQGLGFRAEC